MDRLTCNLRNVKRPIRGLFVGKTIVRDELGVEIPLRIYSRIKRDCNVFAVIDGKEYIIPTEAEFKKLLLKADSKEEKEQLDVTEETVNDIPHVDSVVNTIDIPVSEDENINLVEDTDTITTTSVEIPEETVEEEVPETVEEENNVEEFTEEVEDSTTKPQQYNKNNRKNKNRR